MRRILNLLLISLLLVSCGGNDFFYEEIDVPSTGWSENEEAVFSVNITDTSSVYSVFIDVEHNDKYQYNNLWLFVKITAPNNSIKIDTVNCLFSDYDYYWLGNKHGNNYTVSTLFADSAYFYMSGNYTFEVQQALRVDNIQNINKIALRINTCEVNKK